MPFQLSAADLSTDFDAIMAAMWASHEDPFQPFFRLFCPVNDGDRAASVRESTARMLEWDRHEPHARWLKVEDTATGKIAGAAWYKLYDENPFLHPEEEVVDWYPEDSSREYVGQAIAQMDRHREVLATRPHVFLNILFTNPEYRRQGIGSMLLQWGIDQAKERGVEFWLNATPYGKPLYEKYGFKVVERNPLEPKTDNPDAIWHATDKQFAGIVFWTMYLPVQT